MVSAERLTRECDRPVTDVPIPSRATVAGAFEIHHDGHGPWLARGQGRTFGVIVHRTHPYEAGTVIYTISTCDTAEHRDDTLVPFHAYYDSTLRIERFGPDLPVTGSRSSVRTSLPTREGDGTSRTWSRVLRGVPHGFTAVLMPDGERRYFVTRYNGYGDDGTLHGRHIGMEFGCGWSPVAEWIIKP